MHTLEIFDLACQLARASIAECAEMKNVSLHVLTLVNNSVLNSKACDTLYATRYV